MSYESDCTHNRHDMAKHLVGLPAHQHLAECKKYGWRLIDLEHESGQVVKDHLVDTRSTVEDDLRVKVAANGARGGWKWKDSVKPAAPVSKPAPVKEPVASAE